MVAALLADLDTERPRRRQRARAVLSRLSPRPLLDGMEEALRRQDNAGARNAARTAFSTLAALGAAGPEAAVERLDRLTADDDPDVRVLASTALGESGNPAAVPALIERLGDGEANVAAAAADALGMLRDERAVHPLSELVHSGDPWRRMAAVASLGCIGSPRAVPALATAVEDPALAAAAAASLGQIADPTALAALRSAIASGDAAVRREAEAAAAGILAAVSGIAVPGWLSAALRDEVEALHRRLCDEGEPEAALLLGAAGTETAAVRLIEAARDDARRAEAAAGLTLLPAEVALAAIIPRLADAGEERRILLVALPPLRNQGHFALVERYLADEDAEVRAEAAELLARSPVPDRADRLRRLLDDPERRAGAADAISRLPDAPEELLAELLGDPDPAVRLAVARGLQQAAHRSLAPSLLEALAKEENRRVSRALARAAGATGDSAAIGELDRLLAHEDTGMRYAAAQALGCSGRPEAYDPLLRALDDPSAEVQAAALHALGLLGNAEAAPRITEHLDSGPRDVRRTAAGALRLLAPPSAVSRLREAATDPDPELRLAAVRTLHRIGGAEAEETVARCGREDPEPFIRAEAVRLAARSPEEKGRS